MNRIRILVVIVQWFKSKHSQIFFKIFGKTYIFTQNWFLQLIFFNSNLKTNNWKFEIR